MRLRSRALSLPSRPTRHLVSDGLPKHPFVRCDSDLFLPGLQTPRLKRLAEIVSAQAIAQQEKLENGDSYEGRQSLGEVDEVETEE